MTRKFIPDHIKVAQGTYRKDRDGEPCPPVEAKGVPHKPDDLGEEASDYWDRVVPMLIETGVPREIDEAQLSNLCFWYAENNRAQRVQAEEPSYNNLQMAVMAQKQFDGLSTKFGLDPAGRGKLRVKPTEKKKGVQPVKKRTG